MAALDRSTSVEDEIAPLLASLPASAGIRIRAARDDIYRRVLAAAQESLRAQGRSVEGAVGAAVELGVRTAVDQLVALVSGAPSPVEQVRAVFHQLGRNEYHEGQRVDALRSTLIVGARQIWGALVELDSELDPVHLYALAEALFPLTEALASASVAGYLQEQERQASDWAMARRRLMALLVQRERPPDNVLRAAADAARWQLPATVAVVAVDGTNADQLARELGGGTLGAVVDDATRLVVPDPATPGRREHLLRALVRRTAALGPTVPLGEARRSYRQANRALQLLREGRLRADGVYDCAAHLPELIAWWEPGLLDQFADAALAPLADQPDGQRAVLAETLLAWLREQGRVPRVAEVLHAHPQTVRYRMRRLETLFGDRLNDPGWRFEMEMALRSRMLLV